MNYQNWSGCTDPKFGYGSIPTGTLLDSPQWENPTASVEVHTLRAANATIGGVTYRFKAGEIISLPVGAYQVLSASGAVEMEQP